MGEWTFDNMIDLFRTNPISLLKGYWGIEKEAVRTNLKGELALSPHPKKFGDKLENPYITTDFSESQIEMITPPFDSIEKVYKFLNKIQKFIITNLQKEILWPFSMPPHISNEDKIPIAKYNDSEAGRKNEIYRYGIALRYGRKMQLISGIHYNFSFQFAFWNILYNSFSIAKNMKNFKEFINEAYFALARNYLRYRWLLIYLFGASPIADNDFFNDEINSGNNYAISLRMSSFGYSMNKHDKIKVSFNSLAEYIADLEKILFIDSESYRNLGLFKNGKQVQLNYHILQKESEFYSSIRFKSDVKKGESHLDALKSKGINYIEIRSIDLDPFHKLSISVSQLYFLHIFLLFCLFEDSSPLSDVETEKIKKNDDSIALAGRKKDIKLFRLNHEKIKIKIWGNMIFDKLLVIAQLMDMNNEEHKFENIINEEKKKLTNINILPSVRIINEINCKNGSFIEFGIKKANKFLKEI